MKLLQEATHRKDLNHRYSYSEIPIWCILVANLTKVSTNHGVFLLTLGQMTMGITFVFLHHQPVAEGHKKDWLLWCIIQQSHFFLEWQMCVQSWHLQVGKWQYPLSFMWVQHKDMQYNTIQYNTIQHNKTQHHTTLYHVPYHTIPYHTIPYHTIPYHTIPYHTIPYHTIPYHTMPYHIIQYSTIQYNTIQHNTIQYNKLQYNTIQYNTIQYNTIQYNTAYIYKCNHWTIYDVHPPWCPKESMYHYHRA